MIRKLTGRALQILGTLLFLWSVWSVIDLVLTYQDSTAKGDYAGYGLSLTFYAILLWPSTVAALLGGLVLEPPSALRNLNSTRVRKFTGILLLVAGGTALLASLWFAFLVVNAFLSYARSPEDVAFGLAQLAVFTLPLTGAFALLSLAGFKLVKNDRTYPST